MGGEIKRGTTVLANKYVGAMSFWISNGIARSTKLASRATSMMPLVAAVDSMDDTSDDEDVSVVAVYSMDAASA